MSWLDSYRTASFRGIEFKVEGHDAQFGRRQVTHEFPQRDDPFTEDLGRRARELSVDAYLIGDDYPAQRNRLIAAAETDGPGELVHPYLGNMQVVCTGLSLRESSRETRMCRLQLTFIEAGEAKFPTNVTDAVQSVASSANAFTSAAGGGFLGRFVTKGFPSFVVDAAAAKVAGLSSMLTSLTVNPLGQAQAVASFFTRVRALGENALQLGTEPSNLLAEITGIVGDIRDVFGIRSDTVLRSLRTAYSEPYSGPLTTPNRQQQADNEQALSALIRRAALAEQAKQAVVLADESAAAVAAQGDGATTTAPGLFKTREEAIAVRDELTDALDAEAEIADTTVDEFRTLTDLRTEVVRGVPSPDLALPRVAEVTPPSTLPSLVVAHAFYGTAERAAEIAERNRAPHPGFMTGGKPLQVITDG
jgi:prophage DNA circulation protein